MGTDEKILKKMYPSRIVDLVSFQFFHELENTNFIDVTNNMNLLEIFQYKDTVKLNLCLKDIVNTINEYVNTASNQCILAGGLFSDYDVNNIFAKQYPRLLSNFSKKKDVDLYMLDNNKASFNFYWEKFESLNMKPYAVNDIGYQFNCFKVKMNGFILNMIFVPCIQREKTIHSIIEIVIGFDFNLSKIFYSFKFDAIYFFGHLFSPMFILEKNKNKNKISKAGRVSCFSYIGDFVYMQYKCQDFINRHVCLPYSENKKNLDKDNKFLVDLSKFMDTKFVRCVKYWIFCLNQSLL